VQADFEDTINKMAGGMVLLLFGMLFSVLFQFVTRLLLFRGLSEGDYGVLTLSKVILDITMILAILGLDAGSARFISYARGERKPDRIRGTVRTSLRTGSASGLAFGLALVFLAGTLSRLFHTPELTKVLRIYSLALPAGVLLTVIAGIFRGFDKVGVKVVFVDIIFYCLYACMIVLVMILSLGLYWAALAMTAAYVIAALAIILYAAKKLPGIAERVPPARLTWQLLAFSVPLAMENALAGVSFWADTIMLGILKSASVVGTYNVAIPFANFLMVFLVAFNYIFLPLATKMLGEGRKDEVKVLYQSATKWAFLLTLPLLLTFILFSKPVIVLFAGRRYEEAATALAILSLGFFAHVFLGPNGITLIALGRPRLLLYDMLFGLASGIALNAILIPHWGIYGAAAASSASLILSTSLKSLQIYHLARIHPFTSTYIKPAVLTILASVVLYLPISVMLRGRSLLVILVYPVMLALGLAFTLLSRSVNAVDIALLSYLMSRLKLDPARLQAFLSRFVAGEDRAGGDEAL
jgi:O-antigen/teichoic acid export membrane protein